MNIQDRAEILELDGKVALYEALERLKALPEFKLLLKNYLEDRALSLTYSLGGIALDNTNEHNVTKQLTAISNFKNYLEHVTSEGLEAKEERVNVINRSNP